MTLSSLLSITLKNMADIARQFNSLPTIFLDEDIRPCLLKVTSLVFSSFSFLFFFFLHLIVFPDLNPEMYSALVVAVSTLVFQILNYATLHSKCLCHSGFSINMFIHNSDLNEGDAAFYRLCDFCKFSEF